MRSRTSFIIAVGRITFLSHGSGDINWRYTKYREWRKASQSRTPAGFNLLISCKYATMVPFCSWVYSLVSEGSLSEACEEKQLNLTKSEVFYEHTIELSIFPIWSVGLSYSILRKFGERSKFSVCFWKMGFLPPSSFEASTPIANSCTKLRRVWRIITSAEKSVIITINY